jgi:hypothetical protein
MTAMLAKLILVGLLAGVALLPYAIRAAALTELKSEKVELPDSDKMFPPGPGVDAINNNCLACHSAGMVLTQPAQSKETWARLVHKMIESYKAPVAPQDVGPIVDYLSTTKGAK